MVSIDDLSIGFRGPLLMDGVSSRIEVGQKIGLLGRNGAGKTTLMRILEGKVTPDHGSVTLSPGATVARLSQEVPHDKTGTVSSVVASGQKVAGADDPHEQWQIEHAVEQTLSRMNLDGDAAFETLSSGMKRRVLLARALVSQPDLLLLDEPTNHLDIQSILWLEEFLSRWGGTLLFVTHDRTFLQNLATRIWEIDRGQLFDWSCDYQTFLQRKEAALVAAEKQDALFDKKLAQEEAWIRQGIKARRTRNEGRVRALKAMRVQRQQRRSVEGTAKLNLQQAERSGTLVAEVKDLSFAFGDNQILDRFSTTIMRGDKIGIIGPNGVGKTTLLKLLLAEIKPDAGSVRLGTKMEVAYFDQLRDTLDPNKSLQENVGEGRDTVRFGETTKHILGYLQDFLFTPERARTEVRFLSGGERNRALLAKLMTKPANVIVLDEPTNDLDSETLELLEQQLVDFQGSVLMVSHDRTFLNHVVTSTIVFEDGGVKEYVGGYDDWCATVKRRQDEQAGSEPVNGKGKPATSKPKSKPAAPVRAKKLSYNEQRELDQLPGRIEKVESEIAALHDTMASPDYYQQASDLIAADATRLKSFEDELATAYERWESLESELAD
ncbi:MAG: ATP-binding cassette domain-containing protein [Rubripirellula sp.]|nr:ATP-binding cassette domain-containing protein [Rubripirellula sp.]